MSDSMYFPLWAKLGHFEPLSERQLRSRLRKLTKAEAIDLDLLEIWDNVKAGKGIPKDVMAKEQVPDLPYHRHKWKRLTTEQKLLVHGPKELKTKETIDERRERLRSQRKPSPIKAKAKIPDGPRQRRKRPPLTESEQALIRAKNKEAVRRYQQSGERPPLDQEAKAKRRQQRQAYYQANKERITEKQRERLANETAEQREERLAKMRLISKRIAERKKNLDDRPPIN